MLAALRKGIGSWIAKIFIACLVLSFAVWGVADIFGGYGRRSVATVGDTEIPYQTFQRELRIRMQEVGKQLGRPLTLEEARTLGVDQQVISTLVQRAALENQAASMGLGISDKAIAERILREDDFKGASGRFSQLAFEQLLQQNGLTEQTYVAQQRQAYIRQQLTATLTRAVDLPKTFLRAADIFRNETRKLKYFSLPLEKIDPVGEPTAEALQKYYDSHQSDYTSPEYRKIGVLALLPDEVAEKTAISEQDLKNYYDDRAGNYRTPEKRHVHQIPFLNKAEAQAAYDKLEAGSSFWDIAKERKLSEQDLKLGAVTRKDLADPIISKAAFALAKDEVSKPVEGELSTVLLTVTEIEPEKLTSFDEARDGVRKTLGKERAAEKILDLHNKIEDERAAGSALKEIAQTLNLQYVAAEAIDRDGLGPDGKTLKPLPRQTKILGPAFRTEVNIETDPIETADQGLVWYEVLEITARKLKPFQRVREKVVKDWRRAEERAQLAKKAQDLVNRARKGERLEEIATGLDIGILESGPVKRNGQSGGLPAPAIAQAFALSKGGFGSAANRDGGIRVIFEVASIEQPTALDRAAAEELEKNFVPQMLNDLLGQYVTGLSDAYGVTRNQPLIDQLTGAAPPDTINPGRGLF